ncbi:MAG: hypothetical protein OER90_01430 [Gemmatimonadota bacterium]|nr:hypothetical protein [Gemmatimonadota bacterium]
MNILDGLPAGSRIVLYIIMVAIAVFTLLVLWAQIGILRGRPFENPDGTKDDWREQKIFYGVAWADIAVACPLSLAALIMIFAATRWGFYAMGLVSFWFLWTNVMTTVTSLRFEKPRITLQWIVVFPFGALIGLAYIIWTIAHFDTIFGI